MKSQHLSLGLTAILVTSAVAIGSHSVYIGKRSSSPVNPSTQTTQSQPPVANAFRVTTESQDQPSLPAQTPEIPKHVVYGLLFREMAAFRQKAQELKAQGKDASVVEGYHAKRANLNEAQAAALENIAQDCQAKVDEIEQQAKTIIERDRALHPGGKLQPGETLPKPPKQLQELEQRRRAAIMQAREGVRAAMGEVEFQHFDEFEEKDVAARAKAVGRPPHSVTPPINGFKPRP